MFTDLQAAWVARWFFFDYLVIWTDSISPVGRLPAHTAKAVDRASVDLSEAVALKLLDMRVAERVVKTENDVIRAPKKAKVPGIDHHRLLPNGGWGGLGIEHRSFYGREGGIGANNCSVEVSNTTFYNATSQRKLKVAL